ncbi:MAG: hypothetical protein ACJA0E_001637 [Bermanella sp.]
MKLVTQVEARKSKQGTPVHSQGKAAKYLLTELNNSTLLTDLFTRSNNYRTDAYSKLWRLTDKSVEINELVMGEAIKLIAGHAQQSRVTLFPLHVYSNRCSGKSVNQEADVALSIEVCLPKSLFHDSISLVCVLFCK